MKVLTWIAVLAFAASPCAAARDRHAPTFWERVLQPEKAKAKPKRKARPAKKSSKPKKEPAPKRDVFIVDNEWMAHYWSLVYDYDYSIPEERDIRYIDGKFHVPPVVYRHLQDMMEAKRANP